MESSALCRCICGTGRRDSNTKNWGTPDIDVLEEVDEPPFQPPQVAGRQSYSIAHDQCLRGAPIREGELWYLSTEDKVDPVSFSLYINGFSFSLEGEQEASVSLSPFALVRNCKFQSNYPSLNLTDFKIFKVSLFAQSICYYFGVRGEDEREAEDVRSRWVLDISRAMRLVTQSLFPPFNIVVDPIESTPCTHKRLMAGYLIHHDDNNIASMLYCELHPHCEDRAKLVLYENEVCQTPVLDVYITERSICCEKVGINCSCFSVEDHQFSTRTLAERKLWLRAISNLKVKLQNRAPSPTPDDLQNYRAAIKEHVNSIKEVTWSPTDPLLQRSMWKPRPAFNVTPRGMNGGAGGSDPVTNSPRGVRAPKAEDPDDQPTAPAMAPPPQLALALGNAPASPSRQDPEKGDGTTNAKQSSVANDPQQKVYARRVSGEVVLVQNSHAGADREACSAAPPGASREACSAAPAG